MSIKELHNLFKKCGGVSTSKKVKAIICLGENNLKIIDHFENAVEYIIETQLFCLHL